MIFKKTKIKYLFVDQINVFSLLRICLLVRSLVKVYHFDPIMPLFKGLLQFVRRFGLIRAQVCKINYGIGMVRDDCGESKLIKLYADGLNICNQIEKEHLRDNPLIHSIASDWDKDKILLHFKKNIADMYRPGGIVNECQRIGLIDWVIRSQSHIAREECGLLIGRKKWFSYLEDYASKYNIRLIGYRIYAFSFLFKLYDISFRAVRNVLRALKKTIKDRIRMKGEKKLSENAEQLHYSLRPAIAIKYMGGKFSFDPCKRSEFFWLNGSEISNRDILFYNVSPETPIEPDTLSKIYERGIRMFGTGSGVSVWQSTPRMYNIFLRKIIQISFSYFRCLLRRRCVSSYFTGKLYTLAWDFAYWYDFYCTNNVIIDVSAMKMTTGQVLALDALKGISIAYQYSISNFYPAVGLSAGEDVQFLISRAFEPLWKSVGAPVGKFIETGFIYEGVFEAVQQSKNIIEHRKQLQENHAEFILCFFDENSNNRWDVPETHDRSAGNYRFLLEWLLDDAALGIIFKPKRSRDLLKRISSVRKLIEQAIETGRCKFLMDDTSLGSTYPAEAAMMADLCVGMLSGGTAAFESRLAGIPSVLIDTDGFFSHPFYEWGKGNVVFRNWEALRLAVESYRNATTSYPGFGDWSPGMHSLDPFRDGQACCRMRSFIRWIYEAIEQGISKAKALEEATEKFERTWGAGHIAAGHNVKNFRAFSNP